MTLSDIQFLKMLQAELIATDKDPQKNDYQANPRFWVVMDVVEVESENGEPRILDEVNMVKYTFDEYIDLVDDEIKQINDDCLKNQWNKAIDTLNMRKICKFTTDKLNHDTRIIYVESRSHIAENTFFLTKSAAQEHIKANHHHYCNPRTYAMTAWRSPEFERFLNLFKQFDFSNIKPTL